jgi:predicted ester cyclase
MRLMVDDQVVEGDRVATRFTVHGTHTGDLLGIAPTHKIVTVTGIVFSRLADGQIAEEWENFDQFGMLQQLGALPTRE